MNKLFPANWTIVLLTLGTGSIAVGQVDLPKSEETNAIAKRENFELTMPKPTDNRPECAVEIWTNNSTTSNIEAGPTGILGSAIVGAFQGSKSNKFRSAAANVLDEKNQFDIITQEQLGSYSMSLRRPIYKHVLESEQPPEKKSGSLKIDNNQECRAIFHVREISVVSAATWMGLKVKFSYAANINFDSQIPKKYRRTFRLMVDKKSKDNQSHYENQIRMQFRSALADYRFSIF